jgi:hypothetical protein
MFVDGETEQGRTPPETILEIMCSLSKVATGACRLQVSAILNTFRGGCEWDNL